MRRHDDTEPVVPPEDSQLPKPRDNWDYLSSSRGRFDSQHLHDVVTPDFGTGSSPALSLPSTAVFATETFRNDGPLHVSPSQDSLPNGPSPRDETYDSAVNGLLSLGNYPTNSSAVASAQNDPVHLDVNFPVPCDDVNGIPELFVTCSLDSQKPAVRLFRHYIYCIAPWARLLALR